MTALSGIWDGERHLLTLDEDFPSTGARWVIAGYEPQEEEDVLSPFESPSVEPVLKLTGSDPDPRMPMAGAEQAWGALSVILTSFAAIAEAPKDQYQENNHKTGETLWSFKTKQQLGERI